MAFVMGALLFSIPGEPLANTRRMDAPMQTFFGVHEQYQGENATTPHETHARYPYTTVTREFKPNVLAPQNLIPAMEKLCRATWDMGWLCVVSFKLDPKEVANGKWQPFVEQLGRYLVANERTGHTIITIWHEAENNTASSFPRGTRKRTYFKDAQDYVRYFDTVHGWLKDVSPNILTNQAALGYAYRPTRGGTHDNTAWVEHANEWVTQADVQSIDRYNGRSFPLTDLLLRTDDFGRWKASRPANKRWAVSERGWAADGDAENNVRADAIGAEFDELIALPEEDQPLFYIAWLTSGTEDDAKLLPDPAMSAALNLGMSRALTPAPEPTPAPTESTTRECPVCHGSGRVANDGSVVVQTSVTVTRER